METIKTKSERTIEISSYPPNAMIEQPVYVKIADDLHLDYIGVWLSKEETVAWANALLAAAGESEAAQ